MIARALSIAGSDSSGGAGIQADIKTFQELNVFGMTAITAVTVQNTLGVSRIYPLAEEATTEQIEAVVLDIGVDAVKTGMLFSAGIIEGVARCMKALSIKNLVVDPVMVAKGGTKLLLPDAVLAMKNSLLPLALIVTPNIPEAEELSNLTIRTMHDRCEAAKRIYEYGPSMVIIKGGHDTNGLEIIDLMYDGKTFIELKNKRINTIHTHGTGCTYSAAITAYLALGNSLTQSVKLARIFIQQAIENGINLGKGQGPTNHFAHRHNLIKN